MLLVYFYIELGHYFLRSNCELGMTGFNYYAARNIVKTWHECYLTWPLFTWALLDMTMNYLTWPTLHGMVSTKHDQHMARTILGVTTISLYDESNIKYEKQAELIKSEPAGPLIHPWTTSIFYLNLYKFFKDLCHFMMCLVSTLISSHVCIQQVCKISLHTLRKHAEFSFRCLGKNAEFWFPYRGEYIGFFLHTRQVLWVSIRLLGENTEFRFV